MDTFKPSIEINWRTKAVDLESEFNRMHEWGKVKTNADPELGEELLEKCEDLFNYYLDAIFRGDTPYGKLADNMIQLQNFYPAFYGKDCSGGKWVRIVTETGYNIYYAKPSAKRYSREALERQYDNINRRIGKYENINAKKMSSAQIAAKLKLIDQQKAINEELEVSEYIKCFPSELRYIKILKGKNKYEYLLPYQYDVIDDIQPYVDVIDDPANKHSVKYRQYFTKEDQDQIFYLQTRGIPKNIAVMMCKLQQCYFVVNAQALFAEAYTCEFVKQKTE